MVCDPHLAEDVTQGVFVALAQNARQLTHHPILSGWLHRTTQNLSANAVRTNVRRQTREQEAVAMNELLSAEPDINWEHIAPHLDTALGELSEPDRDAVLLRYFERKSAREMALTLGISDDAAQKRVNRAVERLREFFAKRGVTVGASGLAVAISANAVQAAPVGLAITISSAAALTTTTIATTLAMTTISKTIIGATLVVAIGTTVYQARKNTELRGQVQSLEQQLTAQAQQTDQQQSQADAELATLRDQTARSQSNTTELLRLRDEVSRLRANNLASARQESPITATDEPRTNNAPAAIELPRESWADVGFADPQSALQTRGWAVLTGNRERFKESVFITAGARQIMEQMLAQMIAAAPEAERKRFSQQILDNQLGLEEGLLMPMMAENNARGYTGYQILSQQSPSDEEMILEVATSMTGGASKKETMKLRLFSGNWKVVVDEDFIKAQR